ncbi:hypothetical protein AB0C28_55945 [Nonomuraea sp. NPDC048892]|uniref:hypothetical protein n=1 Tax=Nonomuraea sp. NPDC048892 TaxID=3154624 RepID=UPI0034092C5B
MWNADDSTRALSCPETRLRALNWGLLHDQCSGYDHRSVLLSLVYRFFRRQPGSRPQPRIAGLGWSVFDETVAIEANLGELRGAERAVLAAFVRGAWLDLRTGKAKEDDSTCGESWDLVRTVRAEVIKALLLGVTEADPGWSPPIRLRGARVVGRLDLMGATVEYPLSCEGCFFDSELRLVEATTKTVRIVDSCLPGFNGARLRLDGILNFYRNIVSGGIRLDRARASVMFRCVRRWSARTPPASRWLPTGSMWTAAWNSTMACARMARWCCVGCV